MGSVFLSHDEEEEGTGGGAAWSLDPSFPCSDVIFTHPEKPLQDWLVDPSGVSQVSAGVVLFSPHTTPAV